MLMSKLKKNLLFIIHSSAESGGAEDDVLNLMEHLSKKEVYQLYGMFPNAPRQNEYKKYLNYWGYLLWGYFPVINNGLIPYVKYFLKSFIQVSQILLFIRSRKFDACILSVSVLIWPALLLKLLNQKNIILIKETVEPITARKFVYKCINYASIYTIPNSEMMAKEYRSITGKLNTECVYSSLRGFSNLSDESSELLTSGGNGTLKNLFSRRDITKILFVGNIVKVKNPILAVEAINLIRTTFKNNLKLIIAGNLDTEPSYKKEFDKVIASLNINDEVFTAGYCSKSDLDYLYRNADMMIITSVSEGIPLVLVNALKNRLPIISTKVGGIPEIIKDRFNGLLVNHDPKEIAEAIVGLHKNENLKRVIVDNGYETYRNNFDIETNMKKFDSILKKLNI